MLQVEQASVFFAGPKAKPVHALDKVSLEIPDRGFTVALGTSGCGKSTLLNAMAGFLPLSSGEILLNGQKVTGPDSERGVVMQKDALMPWLSVSENVALGLKFQGVKRKDRQERASLLLEWVGLAEFSNTAPHHLSGGMRQRVSLARALAPDPAILLMDEPFGALDSLTRETMQELLINIWHRSGKQIFFITHSIDEALFLSTELVVMSPRPGRIVARFKPGFIERFSSGETAREIKRDLNFVNMREEIRDIIHQTYRPGDK